MSVAAVKQFFEKVCTDKSLQHELLKIEHALKEAHAATLKTSFEEVVKLGKKENLQFSVDDLVKARNETVTIESTPDKHVAGVRACTTGLYSWDPESDPPSPPSTDPTDPTTPPVDPEEQEPSCTLIWSWKN